MIEAELADIEDALQTACATSGLAPLVGADDVRGVWDGLELDHRRAVVTELFDTIVIRRATRGRPKLDARL